MPSPFFDQHFFLLKIKNNNKIYVYSSLFWRAAGLDNMTKIPLIALQRNDLKKLYAVTGACPDTFLSAKT